LPDAGIVRAGDLSEAAGGLRHVGCALSFHAAASFTQVIEIADRACIMMNTLRCKLDVPARQLGNSALAAN